MLAMKETLPSFPQLIQSLALPDDTHTHPSSRHAFRNPPPVIDDDAMSETKSQASSTKSPDSSPPLPARKRASRSPPAAKENGQGRRYSPYQGHGRGPSIPSINIDKANKTPAEKALPTPPISQSLRRAHRPQPLALAPRSQQSPDIAPAPISALLRSSHQNAAAAGHYPHTASPRISGYVHLPRSPMHMAHPMTPVSIPTLPPNLPISPLSANFVREQGQGDVEMRSGAAATTAAAGH